MRLATGAGWDRPYDLLLKELSLESATLRCLTMGMIYVFKVWAGMRQTSWAMCPLGPPRAAEVAGGGTGDEAGASGDQSQMRRNPGRTARPVSPPPRLRPLSEVVAVWTMHPMQLVVPAGDLDLERVSGKYALPAIRAIRLWNALELTGPETALLMEGSSSGVAYLRRRGPDILRASAQRIAILFPSLPLDAASRV